MINESNAMTFTNRLKYSVSEVSLEEYLAVVESKKVRDANKLCAKKAQKKPTSIRLG